MTDHRAERLGAWCGIVYVVLLMAGSALTATQARLAFALEIVAFAAFLPFLGSLASGLRQAEDGDGTLSATAFGAGLMAVTIKLASAAPILAARDAPVGLAPQLAHTLQAINNASFTLTFFPLAVLLAAVTGVAVRSAALPGWLGWTAAPLAAALVVGGLVGGADLDSEWAGLPMPLFTVWVVAASVVLIRRAGRRPAPVGAAPPSPARAQTAS